MTLRDYQITARDDVYRAWQHARNVLLTMATGAGKTVLFSAVLRDYNTPAVLIAHRSELVSQSCLALNRERVPHSVIGPKELTAEIVKLEHETHGYSAFAWRAAVRVAGVDTLVRRPERWHEQVGLVVIDEAHHVAGGSGGVGGNKWMRAAAMFPNARVLGVTAHALRADGKGLGREADGVFDVLVQGPHARELIDRGFLTDYKMFVPPTDVDFTGVATGRTGDYSMPQLRAATHRAAHLVGDVVKHYIAQAAGKLGLTFAVDVESAAQLCAAYRAAGVTAEVIAGETPIRTRAQIMRAFRDRRILQLVSCDVLGEGTDVPAVEVVSFARRTASFQLMSQQLGRALRVSVNSEHSAKWSEYSDDERRAAIAASDKPRAIILDHVGNLMHHYERRGFPDSKQEYALAARERRGVQDRADVIPLRSCLSCFQVFERFRRACPHCGVAIPPPSGRSTPEQVDGDLVELDPAVLAALRAEVDRVDRAVRLPANVAPHVARAITKNHHARHEAQQALRATMALWGGYQRHLGLDDRDAQRAFYAAFGVDVLTAQTLNTQDATTLDGRVKSELERNNVVEV